MYIGHNQVRMHDIDMVGILYFPRQFRFVHDALEDFSETYGMAFAHLFRKEKFLFVVVHAEADYFAPLHVGDKLEVHLSIKAIGTTSFTIHYKIYKLDRLSERDKTLAGTATTVHVTMDADTREKIPIPERFKLLLGKHLEPSDL